MTENRTWLIVTADDFGLTHSINRAVKTAAEEGILTQASLMVTGRAVEEAVSIAGNTNNLYVGLHLSLTEGLPVCSPEDVPDLVKRDGTFYPLPERQGILLQLKKKVFMQVEREVSAQFRAFSGTGLIFSHVDSHHHLHIHPKLFDLVVKNAVRYGLKTVRIPCEPWHITGRTTKGHRIRNLLYSAIFTPLCSLCRKKAMSKGMFFSNAVFGLFKTGEISEDWLLEFIEIISKKPGVFELYTHPDYQDGPGAKELNALTSPYIRRKITEKGIVLTSYRNVYKNRLP